MKNLKKIVAGITALGMVATMGVSTLASAEETQKTFYTGDVNLDGKVNTLDLLSLKKMLLGLADLQQMYIDGDTLKLVEEEADITTNNSNNDTLYFLESSMKVEIIYQHIPETVGILSVTDNTTFTYNDEYISFQDMAKLSHMTAYVFIEIKSCNGEVLSVSAKDYPNLDTVHTILIENYTLNDNTIILDDGTILNINDSTIFKNIVSLEDIESNCKLNIKYYTIYNGDNYIMTLEKL